MSFMVRMQLILSLLSLLLLYSNAIAIDGTITIDQNSFNLSKTGGTGYLDFKIMGIFWGDYSPSGVSPVDITYCTEPYDYWGKQWPSCGSEQCEIAFPTGNALYSSKDTSGNSAWLYTNVIVTHPNAIEQAYINGIDTDSAITEFNGSIAFCDSNIGKIYGNECNKLQGKTLNIEIYVEDRSSFKCEWEVYHYGYTGIAYGYEGKSVADNSKLLRKHAKITICEDRFEICGVEVDAPSEEIDVPSKDSPRDPCLNVSNSN